MVSCIEHNASYRRKESSWLTEYPMAGTLTNPHFIKISPLHLPILLLVPEVVNRLIGEYNDKVGVTGSRKW
jgi:hypothetical protein